MAHTTTSIDIAATPEKVWQLIGGFDSLPDWLPYIPNSTLSDGGPHPPPGHPGRRRHRRAAGNV